MNVLRYLKRNICAKKHTFFYKTPAGFRDEILPLLEAKVKKISEEKPEDSPAIARCQRGIEVHGLTLKDATVVALTLPLFQDFFLKLGEYKFGFDDDLSKIDYKKIKALTFDVERYSLNLIDYDNISKRNFIEKLQKKFGENEINCVHSSQQATSFEDSSQNCHFEVRKTKNRHSFYIRLSSGGLFQRGYKNHFNGIASVREDVAANLLNQTKSWLKTHSADQFNRILVPFCGSGTFGFELLDQLRGALNQNYEKWFVLGNKFNLQASIHHWLKHHEISPFEFDSKFVTMIDINHKTMASLKNNILSYSLKSGISTEVFDLLTADVFSLKTRNLDIENRAVFIILNPPWGLRLGTSNQSVLIFRKIMKWLENLSSTTRKTSGLLLCPNEQTWSESWIFLKENNFLFETIHYTQGGIHIRALIFTHP